MLFDESNNQVTYTKREQNDRLIDKNCASPLTWYQRVGD